MANESKERDTLEENKQANENFGFIKQEVSQKKWGSKQKKRAGIFITVFLLAVMFGVIASISYKASDYILTNILEDNKREEVDFPTQTVPGTPIGSNGDGENTAVDPAVLEQYSKLMLGVQQVADALSPSIVTVTSVRKDFDAIFGEESPVGTEHTGIILADNQLEYLILVRYSDLYANPVESLSVTFCNGLTAKAEVLKVHEELDLAVVRASHKEYSAEELKQIRVISVGDSSELSAGAVVIAVGSPTGKHLSVDVGMVSSMGEVAYITDSSVSLISTNMFGYEDGFGVLVNTKGKMVGVLTRMFAGERQMLQAYSINELNPLLLYLVNDKQPNSFGAVFQELPKAILNELSLDHGILISEVKPDSPAYRDEFRRGDLITGIGEHDIYFASQFFTVLNRYVPGQEVEITYYRNGKKMVKTVEIQEGK